jgi:hypothetical protein
MTSMRVCFDCFCWMLSRASGQAPGKSGDTRLTKSATVGLIEPAITVDMSVNVA